MKQSNILIFRVCLVLTLALAVIPCLAEGLMFYGQQEWTPEAVTPALIPNAHQAVLNLSGPWEIRSQGEEDWKQAWIPGCYSNAQTRVEFRRSLVVPDSFRVWNLQIHIPEIHYATELWLNGRFISSFTGNHLGFSGDLSRDHIKFGGTNEILLKLDNVLSPDGTLPVFPQLLQPLNYGGIFSGVFIRAVPRWAIEDVNFKEVPGKDSAAVSGSVDIRISRYVPSVPVPESNGIPAEIRAVVTLRDSTGLLIVESKSDPIAAGGTDRFMTTVQLAAFRPQFWSPANPTLYELTAFLISGTDTIHSFTRRAGFKHVRMGGDQVFLNGELFTVRAVDYVPESQRAGRVISEMQLRRDLSAMKELGINAIRVPFGPPPPALVNLADEAGFLLFVEGGLNWLPSSILARARFAQVLEHSYDRLLTQLSGHVSVFAWGIGSNLNWREEATRAVVARLRQTIRARDSRPCFVELAAGITPPPEADLALVQLGLDGARTTVIPNAVGTVPTIIANLGKRASAGDQSVTETSAGIVDQADLIVRSVLSIQERRDLAGFVIHSFADYHGASPLLAQPIRIDPLVYTYGIVGLNRQERIAYFKLRDLAQSGQASPPIGGESHESPPIAFPIVGLASLLLLSIEMRRNNVFRQNLKRVFMHAHGFYSDLRYRRFLHTAQPMLLWLLESVTLALLLSSLLYAMRFSLNFDFYLTHFLPWSDLKALLVQLIWDPPRAVMYFTGLFMVKILLLTLVVRICSIPFRERVDLWQSANYVIWSFAALLFLLPVTVVFYRALNTPQFTSIALVILAIVLVWCLARLLTAVRTGYGASQSKMYVLTFGIAAIVVAVVAVLLSNSRQTFAYLAFFRDMLGAG